MSEQASRVSAEPHKDPRHLVRQLDEACRLGHAQADALATLAAEHALKSESALTWDALQAAIARAGAEQGPAGITITASRSN
jgi:hypothetical protein